MKLQLKDTFNKELPADKETKNTRRQVFDACFSFVEPRVPSDPSMIHTSVEMAEALGISSEEVKSKEFLEIFSGSKLIEGSQPYAMCYGGHQFGHWAGQLGDGRAINIGEIVHDDQRWAMQLKGSGETPYSRSADGLAVLRSSIREHLCSEAMYHLGAPTTRSLSLCLTGDQVLRDVMYDGNPAYEKGAVVCRVAPTFIRFGNFQILASRKDTKTLKALADYTIKYFFPEITTDSKEKYIEFFNQVVDKTLNMVIHWQRVGFVHGVMNTDNMSITGMTIDYGPYGWLEDFDHGWTPNTTDRTDKRYRFGNQPSIAQWNLFQLANALYPLIEDAKPLEAALKRYAEEFHPKYLKMMTSKLGLSEVKPDDESLVERLEKLLSLAETDMTIFFRELANVSKEDSPENAIEKISLAFYDKEVAEKNYFNQWKHWFNSYLERLQEEVNLDLSRREMMRSVNPKYVLRNYMAQLAIDAADKGDYSVVDELYQMLKNPYTEQPEYDKWYAKRPDWARHKVGCSMLSCSS